MLRSRWAGVSSRSAGTLATPTRQRVRVDWKLKRLISGLSTIPTWSASNLLTHFEPITALYSPGAWAR